MTDMEIPEAAVQAARQAREEIVRSIDWASDGTDWPDPMRAALAAALPHLRPLVEAQELRIATEVALKLGRQEALAEVTQRLTEAGARGRFALQVVQHLDEYDAPDTGKGDSA